MSEYIIYDDYELKEINNKLEEIRDNIPNYNPSLNENDKNIMFLIDTIRELVKKVDDIQNEINEIQDQIEARDL